LRDGHFGQSQRFDLTLRAHLLQLSDLIGERYVWVNSVQVVKIDGFDAKSAQAKLHALPQIGWHAARCPLARALSGKSAFRCNDQIVPVGMKCFVDKCFHFMRTVCVSSVDMLDARCYC